MESAQNQNLPYLTSELPGIGGAIKRYNEDFVVEEIPLYAAGGTGTHVYFCIEKQGLPTLAAIRHIARALGRPARDIGYAGLKDAHGITTQWLSIEHEDPDRIAALEFARVRIHSVTRHTNKIKLGHLAGNRFVIKVRDFNSNPPPSLRDERDTNGGSTGHPPPLLSQAQRRLAVARGERGGSVQLARTTIDVLINRGVPNYFGPQRFGVRGDNAAIGRAALTGDFDTAFALMLGRPRDVDHGAPRRARELYDAGDLNSAAATWPKGPFSQQARVCRALIKAKGNQERAWKAVDQTLRRFYVSAFQSELFNRLLARRINEIDCLQTGDMAWKHINGACFRVEDAEVEQPRCDAFEISPTGPMFGRRMTEASGTPGELEASILNETGMQKEELWSRDAARLEGARRPLRVPLQDAALETGEDDRGPFLTVRFFLPPGAYATNVLREICKSDYHHHEPLD